MDDCMYSPEIILQHLKATKLVSYSTEGHSALIALLLSMARVILDKMSVTLDSDEKRDLEFLLMNDGNWTTATGAQVSRWSYSLKSIWKFDHERKIFIWKKTKVVDQIQILLQWYRAHNLPDSALGDYRITLAEGLYNGRVKYAFRGTDI